MRYMLTICEERSMSGRCHILSANISKFSSVQIHNLQKKLCHIHLHKCLPKENGIAKFANKLRRCQNKCFFKV